RRRRAARTDLNRAPVHPYRVREGLAGCRRRERTPSTRPRTPPRSPAADPPVAAGQRPEEVRAFGEG
ncbi:hypothetical protein NGM37_51385, partial [Streptomyces sp. TRM76130]|nr:hypothetical protein [Streptomyces sp. TRM76130]